MAHGLDKTTGKYAFAYAGAPGWHGNGQQVQADASTDEWLIAGQLNYTVRQAAVQYQNGILRTLPKQFVNYRDDTGAGFGVVSDKYKLVQPRDALEFNRELCRDLGCTMETVGALKNGALYWALARTGHNLTINGNDRIEGFILFSTSADGSRATDVRFTATRVVCANTYAIAMQGNTDAVRTKHSTTFSAAATKKALGLISFDDSWNKFHDDMRALSETTISAADASALFADLLRPAGDRAAPRADMGAQSFTDLMTGNAGISVNKAATDKAPVERAIRGLADLEQSYLYAPGAVPGTAYGIVNAVTHYVDHVRGTGNDAAGNDKRTTSAWFGQGDTLKHTAMEKAMELVTR